MELEEREAMSKSLVDTAPQTDVVHTEIFTEDAYFESMNTPEAYEEVLLSYALHCSGLVSMLCLHLVVCYVNIM